MKFNVPDMSCGHCTAAIEKAIKALDAGALVTCDLSERSVRVRADLSQDAVSGALMEAGYVSSPIAAA